MAKSAHAVCPCGFTRVDRPRAASSACGSVPRAVKAAKRSRYIEVCARKQDPDGLSVSTQGQLLPANPEDLKTYQKRRWSNLNRQLVHVPGTVIGSATLIAGTTIGASPASASINIRECCVSICRSKKRCIDSNLCCLCRRWHSSVAGSNEGCGLRPLLCHSPGLLLLLCDDRPLHHRGEHLCLPACTRPATLPRFR